MFNPDLVFSVSLEEVILYDMLVFALATLWAYISMIYNRNYGKHLIDKGYMVAGVEGGNHDSLEAVWNMEIPKADTTTFVTEIKMK